MERGIRTVKEGGPEWVGGEVNGGPTTRVVEREREREATAWVGGRGRGAGCGGLSIVSVERKREWERDEERGEGAREGCIFWDKFPKYDGVVQYCVKRKSE